MKIERVILPERTKQSERTWYDVWQSKRIAKRPTMKQFEQIQAMAELRDFAVVRDRTKSR